MNKYQKEAQTVLERAKAYRAYTHLIHVSTNKHGTTLHKKHIETSDIPCYIVETTIKKNASDLASKIWDVTEDIVKKYDHDITSWKEIEKGDTWKVCHQTTAAPWPIWPRELAFSQVKIVEDNTIWLVAFSVDHEQVPLRDKEFVRAIIIMSIWGFTAVNENETKVCRIVHVEPRGSIPTWVVNATVNKHVAIVENLGNR